MTPRYPGTFIQAAAAIHPADARLPRPSGRHAWVQDDAATKDPPVTDPRLLRPATPAGLAASQNLHPGPFHDPCNYLG